MKKIITAFVFILGVLQLQAQNYDSYYLKKAYAALEEEKADVAQSAYNVYKKMTDKTDPDFELLLSDLQNKDQQKDDWKSECTIISVNETLSIVIQPFTIKNNVTLEKANATARASRLGNHTDWRLPTYEEILLILPNLDLSTNAYTWAWFQPEKFENVERNVININTFELGRMSNSENLKELCLIVRTFNPQKEQ